MNDKIVKPLVILDRDGVITPETGDYIKSPSDLDIIPGSSQAIQLLNEKDINVVIASNQSGVGRGLMSDEDLEEVHKRLEELLLNEKARLNEYYYCTDMDDNSECRKPNPGLLIKAMEDFKAKPEFTWMVGDNETDVLAGSALHINTVLVLSGKSKLKDIKDFRTKPDYIFPDLLWFVRWLIPKI